MKPIIIIGAGLSGLACAVTLSRAGKRVLLLEKRELVGGRVYTQQTPSGFLVDEGFQVLLSSYPELSHVVALKELKLKPFNSGALIFNGQSLELLANPFRHPLRSLETLKFSSASLRDKALVVKLMARVLFKRPQDRIGSPTTLEYLTDFGFSQRFIDDFWKPFLRGVYLDPTLSLGSGFFEFLMNCFAWGEVTLPAGGMNALPQAIAKQLPPDSVRLNVSVKTWEPHQVILENGETIQASAVVCAFDPKLQEKKREAFFRKAHTFYFTSPAISSLGWERWLILVPAHLGFSISHLALISSVAPGYSKHGEPLLSVTVVGEKHCSASEVIQEVEKLAGKELGLNSVATTEVPYALPIIETELQGYENQDGIWLCGDRFASPSINGALRSGRLVAEAILLVTFS
ncbi:FAD-dependent oxidoreductase [bacterium]|nr:FAD-dependent oxidoreductase [bacterium]